MEGQRDEASQSWAPEVLLTAQSPCWTAPWVSGTLQMGLLSSHCTESW